MQPHSHRHSMREPSQWDTAAADIIVREAGGVVLYAGKCSNKGELLEDWKVSAAVVGSRWFGLCALRGLMRGIGSVVGWQGAGWEGCRLGGM